MNDYTFVDSPIECTHEYLLEDNICAHCGMTALRGNGPKGGDKSIRKDLEVLDFPLEIKEHAEEIYQQLSQVTRRGNRRKQLIFFCVTRAYNNLNQPQDPKTIARIVGIKKSEMSKALSAFSEPQTGYRFSSKFTTAKDLIPSYCSDVGLPEEIQEDVLRLADEILRKDPDLSEKFPQNTAAGLIAYYMMTHGYDFNKKKYASIVQLSDVTIQNMLKRIAHVDNQNLIL